VSKGSFCEELAITMAAEKFAGILSFDEVQDRLPDGR
jgi:hypothetical protein